MHLLNFAMACREVDIGLVLALLVAVAAGDGGERADAAHALLLWRSGNRGVPQATAALYVAALNVRSCGSPWHSAAHESTRMRVLGCSTQHDDPPHRAAM